MSYALIPAGIVRSAARDWLDKRRERIAHKREAMVDSLMARRWFRPKSREDAHRRLGEDRWGDYRLLSISGGAQVGQVESLLSLARCVPDDQPVHVSADHAWVVRAYQKAQA